MSRKEKFSRTSRKARKYKADSYFELEQTKEQPETLPPRQKKFPSSKQKLTKIYYNVLFVLFIILIAFLFWYGKQYTASQK